ncbi:AAA-domain-containing protein [Aaosphaeria arxii CBS 175.79]|uniref:AAA-domain-containing protein n=1 Tax=Aaosphaeria arxii CBS 175.79 TaxID=1450172 RepID=A0A6A5XG30_9PLEO|nr:AAA-domain-containing protein [Aaosphaeria arxii CBS 175.79]KAF2011806.1 AAA-domain-containing protein [Aaosphaeria arxii CBS 175.79]
MRANPSTSMQKTYDECYLTCSTAVYFESQNNEAEALRSWRTALDQIYYHNAYRVSSNYRPRTETEKALHDSLRQLELQCKERVDLLEALKRSREDIDESLPASAQSLKTIGTSTASASSKIPQQVSAQADDAGNLNWMGGGTVPPVGYSDISRPPLPHRPALPVRRSSGTDSLRLNSLTEASSSLSLSPQPTNQDKKSRTPSPEKRGRMLRTLRPGKDGSKSSSSKLPNSARARPQAAAKAATQAWESTTNGYPSRPLHTETHSSKESPGRPNMASAPSSFDRPGAGPDSEKPNITPRHEVLSSSSHPLRTGDSLEPESSRTTRQPQGQSGSKQTVATHLVPRSLPKDLPAITRESPFTTPDRANTAHRQGPPLLSYRDEYSTIVPKRRVVAGAAAVRSFSNSVQGNNTSKTKHDTRSSTQSPALVENYGKRHVPMNPFGADAFDAPGAQNPEMQQEFQEVKTKEPSARADLPPTPTSEAGETSISETGSDEWKTRVKAILKDLPRGVDKSAAQQILNEIVIHGDEVHWDDVAGLEIAKSALKETVVYPFLRPDLFMGLREPARGMLLFGPPGTGKTMLARAVATESRSTFFAISASSLTSKFLGESEKLVRALFALAKLLAPAIIFVDEIDSLLSSRSSTGEHEATRRIKTEFLIQWSDLARAAAGREQTERDKDRGDASRVLVLAATNIPWAIDEAARRRFVRRQYIPLPEDHVRRTQLQTLLGHQKHELSEEDMNQLVASTEGFSGSDITALAKDAAMGPLRSLGEKLLHMTMDEIRPIRFEDFKASLQTIRPSVSKQGLKEFEDWAKEFGERGG